MDTERIEWLHRMGIDVWRLRKTTTSATQREPAIQSSSDSTLEDNQSTLTAPSSPLASSESASNTAAFNTSPSSSNSSDAATSNPETQQSVSAQEVSTDNLSIHLRCVSSGKVLAVFDNDNRLPQEMYRGVVAALNGFQESNSQEVDFNWPPQLDAVADKGSNQASIEGARRALRSLINRNEWEPKVVLVVGAGAATVAQELENSVESILKIDAFPKDAKSKRQLWQQIVSMS